MKTLTETGDVGRGTWDVETLHARRFCKKPPLKAPTLLGAYFDVQLQCMAQITEFI